MNRSPGVEVAKASNLENLRRETAGTCSCSSLRWPVSTAGYSGYGPGRNPSGNRDPRISVHEDGGIHS